MITLTESGQALKEEAVLILQKNLKKGILRGI